MPDRPIPATLDQFRDAFGFTEHRQALLHQHAAFLTYLRSLGLSGAEQWINGSFVTQKPRPNDLDLVTFVPYRQHQQLEGDLRVLIMAYPGLDAYAVRTYPVGHSKHFLTNLDQTEWLSLFSRSRTDRRTNHRHPKGFVLLTID